VGGHPSPQSSPLQQGERRDKSDGIQTDNQRILPRRGNRITFVLPWRATKGQHQPASSSLSASRELHLALFPQGQSRPGFASQKLKCNYECARSGRQNAHSLT
jgi:hypothetical protein